MCVCVCVCVSVCVCVCLCVCLCVYVHFYRLSSFEVISYLDGTWGCRINRRTSTALKYRPTLCYCDMSI